MVRNATKFRESGRAKRLALREPERSVVSEGDVSIGIAEPERAAGAEVPEGAGAGTEPALRHGELEAETEARRPLEDEILRVHLLRDRHRYRRGRVFRTGQVLVATEQGHAAERLLLVRINLREAGYDTARRASLLRERYHSTATTHPR